MPRRKIVVCGQLREMIEQISLRYHHQPEDDLAENGLVKLDDNTSLTQAGITPYLTIMEEKSKQERGDDPDVRLKGARPTHWNFAQLKFC